MNDRAVLPPQAQVQEAAGAGARRGSRIDRSDPLWYKDAIIYQLHIKAFHDSNGDGIGDFAGLMQRLDYVEALGVTAIWILPFYPSPLRDDGYDISDYRSVNSSYGTMRDFRRFVEEAHRRNIRVITELVINHTSDQHPWFQKARRAKPGSPARDMYVWSDTDQKYKGTRIIFLDTESSNWTWDPVAKAFFWHRFYSHQPDLNFDNPRVFDEVVKLLHYWLDMGVDGLRLDAIPYLVEREGTNNENLPETHEVLKRIRAELDAHYSDRMLLAEANQWPEDTRPYFGEGDECHMGFHFPLMPRMYMAVAQEDRHPITDIIRQTPDIPENCQWAIFLRNHDELTLEMVTDEERDYLWRTYANDRRARINLGIRRRLAPLMENDRRKIELMNGLLMSMPGTPIVYYGDELGMGDNYYLGDRDGVRTPMQWSADRNGGFSRANPQQLYLPPIMDPVYGFQAVNVEAQQTDPSSLLNWMRRLIAVRKRYRAFGRGSLRFLYPRNRKILAYVREYEDETMLCVANLSRSAQAVELDLSPWRGAVPVELSGQSAFPPVGELPYMFTLPAFGFYWFALAQEAELPRWYTPTPEPLPEFITLTAQAGTLDSTLSGRERQHLERDALPGFLQRQRWFGAKDRALASVTLEPFADAGRGRYKLAAANVSFRDGSAQRYFLPLGMHWGEENVRHGAPKLSHTLAKVRRGPRLGALVDAAFDEDFARTLIAAMRDGSSGDAGALRLHGTEALKDLTDLEAVRPVSVEQSNVSLILGEAVMLKVYRRIEAGMQPELEIARFLTEQASFPNTPAYLGSAEYAPEGAEPTALAAAFAFVVNQGDAWSVVVDALERALEVVGLQPPTAAAEQGPAVPMQTLALPLDLPAILGRRTAELHLAFATPTDDPAFSAEPATQDDIATWAAEARAQAEAAFSTLEAARAKADAGARAEMERLIEARSAAMARFDALGTIAPSGVKTRIHGDYHLGQVLVAQNDVMIIDFEGEPQRALAYRRRKTSAWKDVAGMLRSLDYAAFVALDRLRSRRAGDMEPVEQRVFAWRAQASRDFLDAYRATMREASGQDRDEAADSLLDLFLLEKAFYEVAYEAANRPAWVSIPVRGILNILQSSDEAK